ncbi:MAG: cation:proton antiporter [Pseudonocardiaceae bacterium]
MFTLGISIADSGQHVDHVELVVGVLAALITILTATFVCGRLAQWVGQPRVVGEMVAGVILGPSIFGALLPSAQQEIFTPDVKSALYVLSIIGLTFFMFLVGAGIDHRFLSRSAVRRSAVIATVGLAVPFILGTGVGLLLYQQLAPPNSTSVQFVLFLGGALSITAFPMLAHILQERRMSSSRIGSMTLVAASIDDAGAWALLAIVIALGSTGSTSGALFTILGAALFAVLMLTVGRRLLTPLARHVERTGAMTHGSMLTVLLVVVGGGWVTDMIGVHSVLGGFIAGLAMPSSPVLRRELVTRLMDVNTVLLLPVFFVFSGLNTDLSELLTLRLIPVVTLVIVVAFVGKYVGIALAVRMHGFSWRQASAVGALMNARGLMVLIFINVGMAHGLVSHEVFAILVVVAVVTTAAALPLYRASLPDALEEAERNAVTGQEQPRAAVAAAPVAPAVGGPCPACSLGTRSAHTP